MQTTLLFDPNRKTKKKWTSVCADSDCQDKSCHGSLSDSVSSSSHGSSHKSKTPSPPLSQAALENSTITTLQKLLTALGRQLEAQTHCGCGHAHASSRQTSKELNSPVTDIESSKNNEPELVLEEPEDCAIKVGEVGEAIANLNGLYVVAPIIDSFVAMTNPSATKSFWLNPKVTRLDLSLIGILAAALLIIWMMKGASYCHAQQEINSRTLKNLIKLIEFALTLAKSGKTQTTAGVPLMDLTIAIDGKNIALKDFTLINPQEAPPLNWYLRFLLAGDVGAHMLEYVGMSSIPIDAVTNNSATQFSLLSFCLILSYFVCKSEQATCRSTLVIWEALKKGQIINDPTANAPNNWTKVAAVGKFPALLIDVTLNCSQAFYGNLPSALVLGLLISITDTEISYIIASRTQTTGQIQSDQDIIIEDNRSDWQKITPAAKIYIGSRAFGTGGERSQPITQTLIRLLNLSKGDQAITSIILWLAMTGTAYSQARNGVEHVAAQNYQLACGLFDTLKKSQLSFRASTTNPLSKGLL